MKRDIDVWRNHQLPDQAAKSIIYDAIIGGGIDAPKHIAKFVPALLCARARAYRDGDAPLPSKSTSSPRRPSSATRSQ
jgi:hypothetical protein